MHEYTGLNVNEIEELEYIDYLQYRRDAFIHEMNKTEEGRRNIWKMRGRYHRQSRTDRALRRLFGKRG